MRIVIIEDEVKTARALSRMIISVAEDAKIVATLESANASVDYFATHLTCNLIFMDVHLSAGLCFDTLEETSVSRPVVFCTTCDVYAIEASRRTGSITS